MKTFTFIVALLAVCALNGCSEDSNPPIQFDAYGNQMDDNSGRGAIGQ